MCVFLVLVILQTWHENDKKICQAGLVWHGQGDMNNYTKTRDQLKRELKQIYNNNSNVKKI